MFHSSGSADGIFDSLVFAAIVVFAIRGLAWNRVKGLLAGGWLTTQGRVEHGSVEVRRVRYFSYYIARIDYSYSVNGEYYSGYLERIFLRERSADRFLASMKGQAVFVRANPHRPERSVLRAEDQMGAWPA